MQEAVGDRTPRRRQSRSDAAWRGRRTSGSRWCCRRRTWLVRCAAASPSARRERRRATAGASARPRCRGRQSPARRKPGRSLPCASPCTRKRKRSLKTDLTRRSTVWRSHARATLRTGKSPPSRRRTRRRRSHSPSCMRTMRLQAEGGEGRVAPAQPNATNCRIVLVDDIAALRSGKRDEEADDERAQHVDEQCAPRKCLAEHARRGAGAPDSAPCRRVRCRGRSRNRLHRIAGDSSPSAVALSRADDLSTRTPAAGALARRRATTVNAQFRTLHSAACLCAAST